MNNKGVGYTSFLFFCYMVKYDYEKEGEYQRFLIDRWYI